MLSSVLRNAKKKTFAVVALGVAEPSAVSLFWLGLFQLFRAVVGFFGLSDVGVVGHFLTSVFGFLRFPADHHTLCGF